jgi:DNA-binding transcriptional LysR family regulator
MIRCLPLLLQSIVCICYIHRVNLAALDLNLLVALDALLSEAHVSRAAKRIGLSQPAASHALRRLREVVGDPLLVRVGTKMELTPRARALRLPLKRSLDQVSALFTAERFDPATSEHRFLLMLPDLVAEVLLPPLLERLSREAPLVRLDITPWRNPSMMTEEFRNSIDLAVCWIVDALAGFHRKHLYTDTDVIAVRRGHPVGAKLSRLDAFLDARHVAVISPSQIVDPIDIWLSEKRIVRRVALAVPSYLQALRVVALTDLVAFVPSRLVTALSRPLSLIRVSPPLDPGIDEQFMFFPKRVQSDPASVWLRRLLFKIAQELPEAGMPKLSGSS